MAEIDLKAQVGVLTYILRKLAIVPSEDLVCWTQCILCFDEWDNSEEESHGPGCALTPGGVAAFEKRFRLLETVAEESRKYLRGSLNQKELVEALEALDRG